MNPIEQANKIMNGCGKIIDVKTYCGKPTILNKIYYCDKCQASRQTAIDIFKEELNWLKLTFKELREVRTKVAGLSSFQMRINDRIKELNSALEILK